MNRDTFIQFYLDTKEGFMRKRILLPVLFSMLSTAAFADMHEESIPYLGLHLGYSHQDDDNGDRDGAHLGFKGVYSMQSDRWFFDPGLGMQYEELSGKEDIGTLSAFGEIDARYKFSDMVSVGPMTSLQFGGNQSRNDTEDGSSTLWMAGARMMLQKEDNGGDPYRWEFSVQRSISGDGDRELYAVAVGVQFGFPWEKKEKHMPAPVCAPCKQSRRSDAKVRIQPSKVNFAFDSAEVPTHSEDKLGDLSRVIKNRQEDIELIRVEGHADERGSNEYNQDLSEKRAESVKSVLIRNGVNEEKIQTKGYGETRPLDSGSNEEAWSKNRRTDVKFYGIKKDKEQFQKELREASAE